VRECRLLKAKQPWRSSGVEDEEKGSAPSMKPKTLGPKTNGKGPKPICVSQQSENALEAEIKTRKSSKDTEAFRSKRFPSSPSPSPDPTRPLSLKNFGLHAARLERMVRY
jgi:hypothetical protein